MVIFFFGNVGILLCLLFEATIFRCLRQRCGCFRNMQKQFESMDAITDDYYDEINLKFLLNEYQRAKQDKKAVRKILNKMEDDDH